MTEFRSMGARPDATRGTNAIEVRKGLEGIFTDAGVLPGAPSPLVTGAASWHYVVGSARWVTRRATGDGLHLWGNEGPLLLPAQPAPGAGLSRIDIIYALAKSATENGDGDSEHVVAVAVGTPASPGGAPSLPPGALELARNVMASTATSTNSTGNTITQTAPSASIRGTGTSASVAFSPVAPYEAASGHVVGGLRLVGDRVYVTPGRLKRTTSSPVTNDAASRYDLCDQVPAQYRPQFEVTMPAIAHFGTSTPCLIEVHFQPDGYVKWRSSVSATFNTSNADWIQIPSASWPAP